MKMTLPKVLVKEILGPPPWMKLTRCSPSLKHPNKTLTCKHPNDANDTIDANHLSTRHVCKLRPEQVNDNVVTSQAMTQFRESQSETTSHHKNSTSEIEETQQMQLTQLTDWLIEGKMLACFCEISHQQQEICIAMWPGDASWRGYMFIHPGHMQTQVLDMPNK